MEFSTTRTTPSGLTVSKNSSKIAKKVTPSQTRSPVIVYVKSPEVIKTRPEEFMALVQRLTGKEHGSSDVSYSSEEQEKKVVAGNEADSAKFGGGFNMHADWRRDFELTL